MASNSSMILVALLPTINNSTRDQLLAAMTKVSENAYAHEPGVHQFALLVPRDEDSSSPGNGSASPLYSVERYASQEAFRSHLNTSLVKDMFAWINSSKIYETTPTVHQLTPLHDASSVGHNSSTADDRFEFIRPALANVPDPFVVVRQIDYFGGTEAAKASLPVWETAVSMAGAPTNGDSSSDTSGALAYGVYSAVDPTSRLFTLSAYASEEAYRQNAATESGEGGIEGPKPLFLKLRGGFLYKSPA